MYSHSVDPITATPTPSEPTLRVRTLPSLTLTVLLFLSLLGPGLCVTDISLQNCPSQYNLTLASSVTEGDRSLAAQFYAGFASEADNARIQVIVTSGNKEALRAYMFEKIVPFAIVAGVVLLVFLLLLYYCLFDKSFPPCESLRRNPLEKPYSLV